MTSSALSLLLLDPAARTSPLLHIDPPIPAGFPSPAGDYLESRIDLSAELIRNPTATFLARVRGESMRDAGLSDGDLILVDRSRTPHNGSMVLAWVDGGFTVKFLHTHPRGCTLRAANPDFPDIEIREEDDSIIWGIVTYVIHSCEQTG